MPDLRRAHAWSPSIRRPGLRAGATTVAASLLTLSLAACGSQLDPGTVAGVNGSGVVAGDGTMVEGGVAEGGVPGSTSGGTTGGTSGGTTGGTSGGTTGGTSGGSTGGGTTEGTGSNSATGGVKAGSCDGFKNDTGMTNDKIVIGNASDISGPVPGLFESSQEALKAYVAYFNSTNPDGICGRKLELKTYDSRADAAANQQAYTDACESTFAMVGSMSAFDSGGAGTTEQCGLPDLRSAIVTKDRYACSTCYGAQSTNGVEFQNAVPDYVKKNFPDAAKNAAMTYVNAGAASENGAIQADAMTKRGMRFVYEQGIDVAEFNYSPYVQQMKDKGANYVQMIASTAQFVRLAQAMKQQGFKPDVFMLDPTAYNPEYLSSGGDDVEGTTVFINFTPFEEASRNKEVQLYLSWLQQVKPGATPTFFGLFSWSAARLFVERSIALGGKLSRSTLLGELGKVDNWTANDMHAPQHVGSKRTGDCWRFLKVSGGRFVPVGGTKYTCAGTTTVG